MPALSSGSASSSAPVRTSPRGAADESRPFFAQFAMGRWRSLIIVVVLMAAMFVVPFAGAALGATLEMALFSDGEAPRGSTAVMILIGNLAVGALGLVTVLLMRSIGKVPVSACFSLGRAFSWRRLLRFAAIMLPPTLAVVVVLEVLSGAAELPTTVSATTVVALIVVVLTAPVQAAGEEVVFRGGIGPAVGSWIRAPRAAMMLGLLVSSVLFGLVHLPGDPDPWLVFYYVWLGLVFGLSAVLTRGLEAPIALHAVNNVLTLGVGVLLSDGGALVVDRSAGGEGSGMLAVAVFVPAHVLLLVVLTLIARRRSRARAR